MRAIFSDSSNLEFSLSAENSLLVLVCTVCFAVRAENISLLLLLSHCNKRTIQFVINCLSQSVNCTKAPSGCAFRDMILCFPETVRSFSLDSAKTDQHFLHI